MWIVLSEWLSDKKAEGSRLMAVRCLKAFAARCNGESLTEMVESIFAALEKASRPAEKRTLLSGETKNCFSVKYMQLTRKQSSSPQLSLMAGGFRLTTEWREKKPKYFELSILVLEICIENVGFFSRHRV